MVRYGNKPPGFGIQKMDVTAGLPDRFKTEKNEYFNNFTS